MAMTAQERLARLLGDSEPAGAFSAQLQALAHLLQLEVAGVGPVRLPVRALVANTRHKAVTDLAWLTSTWE